MVKLHIKRGDESQFLYETTVEASLAELVTQLVRLHNGRLKVDRLCQGWELGVGTNWRLQVFCRAWRGVVALLCTLYLHQVVRDRGVETNWLIVLALMKVHVLDKLVLKQGRGWGWI